MSEKPKKNKYEQMETTPTIRTPRISDLADINTVYNESWIDTYVNEQAGVTEEYLKDNYVRSMSSKSMNNLQGKLLERIRDDTISVVEVRDRVVGVGTVDTREESNTLGTIYLLPEYKGKGLGRKLWESLKTKIDLTKPTYLEVLEYNTDAIGFYEKLGFVPVGEVIDKKISELNPSGTVPVLKMVLEPTEM